MAGIQKKVVCEKEGHSYFIVKWWYEKKGREEGWGEFQNVIYKAFIVCTKCGEARIVKMENNKTNE